MAIFLPKNFDYENNSAKYYTLMEQRFNPGMDTGWETFYFNGIDIGMFGLKFVPLDNDVYQYQNGRYTVSSETMKGHDGGYFYGTTVQPKEFTLRCLLEETFFTNGLLSMINDYFKRGKTGKLLFRSRAWIWYAATVTDNPTYEILAGRNMIITFRFTAYYPYARSDYKNLDDALDDLKKKYYTLPQDEYGNVSISYKNEILENTAFLKKDMTPPLLLGVFKKEDFVLGNSIKTIVARLVNPGTMKAKTVIELSGKTGAGITIFNASNKTLAHFTNLETKNNAYLSCDGMNGKTTFVNGMTNKSAYMYHDKGFVELLPSYPVIRDFKIRPKGGYGDDRKIGYILIPFAELNQFNPDAVHLMKAKHKYIWLSDYPNNTTNSDLVAELSNVFDNPSSSSPDLNDFTEDDDKLFEQLAEAIEKDNFSGEGAGSLPTTPEYYNKGWHHIKSIVLNVIRPGTQEYKNILGESTTDKNPYYCLTVLFYSHVFRGTRKPRWFYGTVAKLNVIRITADDVDNPPDNLKINIRSYPTFG